MREGGETVNKSDGAGLSGRCKSAGALTRGKPSLRSPVGTRESGRHAPSISSPAPRSYSCLGGGSPASQLTTSLTLRLPRALCPASTLTQHGLLRRQLLADAYKPGHYRLR